MTLVKNNKNNKKKATMKPIRASVVTLFMTLSLTGQAATSVTTPVVQPLPAYSTQASIAVRGQAQPSVHIFVDGGVQRAHGVSGADGTFNVSVALKRNQRNNLSVFASTDAQGDDHNSSRVRLSIVEDDIAPLISATLDPAPNAAGWHRRPVKVEFHCSDRDGSGVSDCPDDVRVGTPGAQQTITGRVKDKAGNSAAVSVVLDIDDSAPAVLLDAPADGTLFYSSPVHLSGTFAESLSGVAAVNCNNVPAIVSGNSFSCDVPLENGNNAIKVWAVDAAGNVGIARKSLVLGPALPGGDAHQTMASGHVNKHVNDDVVHTDFLTREVSILIGNGDGTFQPERRVLVGPYPSAVALADVNGDGIADLVTTHYTTKEVAIQYGRADGGFTTGPRFEVDAFPSALVVADLNGDGRPDLLTAHMLNRHVHLHVAQPDGSFKEKDEFVVGDGPVALAVGEIDGDGKLDIVTANFTSGDVSLLRGKGKGKFHGEQRLALSAPNAKKAAAALGVNAAPSAIAIADVNGDTFADIVTTDYGSNSISLLLGAGQGRFQSVRTLAVGQQPVALAVADVTGDGKLDLISANLGSSDLSVLRGLGAAGFAPEQRIDYGDCSGVAQRAAGKRWSADPGERRQHRGLASRGRGRERRLYGSVLGGGGDECAVHGVPAAGVGRERVRRFASHYTESAERHTSG